MSITDHILKGVSAAAVNVCIYKSRTVNMFVTLSEVLLQINVDVVYILNLFFLI